MAKAAKSLAATKRKWVGAIVQCYIRDHAGKRKGPLYGVVRGISDNQVAVEQEGGREFNATGLLVEIPDLGRHTTYGEWPVRFDDARIER